MSAPSVREVVQSPLVVMMSAIAKVCFRVYIIVFRHK